MDDVPLCPDWWPQLIWRLHFPLKVPHRGPDPGPVNMPVAMNTILVGLSMHTFTYLMPDQKAAQQMRDGLENQIAANVKQLSAAHDKAMTNR